MIGVKAPLAHTPSMVPWSMSHTNTRGRLVKYWVGKGGKEWWWCVTCETLSAVQITEIFFCSRIFSLLKQTKNCHCWNKYLSFLMHFENCQQYLNQRTENHLKIFHSFMKFICFNVLKNILACIKNLLPQMFSAAVGSY
jgi:hypothetical protein